VGDQPPALRFSENTLEASDNTPGHGARPGLEKAVNKLLHNRGAETRQPSRANQGLDVKVNVLPPLPDCRGLKPVALATLDPKIGAFAEGDRLAVGTWIPAATSARAFTI